jgi:TPR repeat protein
MFVRNLLLLVGLSVLLAGCSTGRYSGYDYAASHSASPTEMGSRYLLGRGVPQNNEMAFSYFSQAGEEDPSAQNELGYMYATGKGTTQDYRKAIYYYEKAANNGLASAQYNLGLLYLHGLGTEPNKTVAMKWFQLSAAHGFEPAKQALKKYQTS